MDNDTQLAVIAHTIQVAVAPVFLLGGVSSMLGVLTSRLARIVDRARALEAEGQGASPELQYLVAQGLQRLSRRARLTSKAIAFCIGCALLISSVIVVLFVGAFSRWNMAVPTAALFVLAVLSLICGLVCFLREVQLATRYLRIGEVEPEQRLASNEPTG